MSFDFLQAIYSVLVGEDIIRCREIVPMLAISGVILFYQTMVGSRGANLQKTTMITIYQALTSLSVVGLGQFLVKEICSTIKFGPFVHVSCMVQS